MSESTTSIYLLHYPERIYKVGIAKDVKRRVENIQVSCPFTVTLVNTFESSNAREEEADIHNALSHWRLRGEWFQLRARLADQLKAFFAKRDSLGPDCQLRFAEFVASQRPPRPQTNGIGALKANSKLRYQR